MWSPASSILLLPPVLMNSLRSDYQISGCHYSPDTNGIFMKGKICNLSESLLETKQFVCRWDVSASLSDCTADWEGGWSVPPRANLSLIFFSPHVQCSGFNSFCGACIYLLIRLSFQSHDLPKRIKYGTPQKLWSIKHGASNRRLNETGKIMKDALCVTL